MYIFYSLILEFEKDNLPATSKESFDMFGDDVVVLTEQSFFLIKTILIYL